jgi:hypothetical protein
MIRKQIYIRHQQQALLRRLARQRGVSEAEIIRRAIDRETASQDILPLADSHAALEEILQAAYANREQAGIPARPYRFNRAELYGEREGRWVGEEKQD